VPRPKYYGQFLHPEISTMLFIGFIGTFPDSSEDYRTKHEISSNYRSRYL